MKLDKNENKDIFKNMANIIEKANITKEELVGLSELAQKLKSNPINGFYKFTTRHGIYTEPEIKRMLRVPRERK